jgi:hypothetical protein
MKSSDVVPSATTSEIPVDEQFMFRNATLCGTGVDWRRSRIGSTRGAAESTPRAYGRDAAVKQHDLRKQCHRALDSILADADYSNEAESRRMHDAVDELLDEQESSSTGRRKVSKDRSFARDAGNLSMADYERSERLRRASTSYITDADHVEQFLNPRQLCIDAVHDLYDASYEGQRDPAKRSFWSGLIHMLSNGAQKGSRIRDLNQAALSALVQKITEA